MLAQFGRITTVAFVVSALAACTAMPGGSGSPGADNGAGSVAGAAADAPPPADGVTRAREGSRLSNLVRFGSTTAPEIIPDIPEFAPCPQVDIITGGAAIRNYAGSASNQNLRSQISIANLARECVVSRDGETFNITLGVEGRALLGPRGGPGRFNAPLRIVLRNNTETFEDRRVQASATVESGASSGSFTVVEENLTVPARVGSNYIIEVGLVSGGR
ncbi:MAG: hypothetical protein JJU21_03765 [Salinarimonas sp.]|nr:hypothetical protein [Salinarimonas sp.]